MNKIPMKKTNLLRGKEIPLPKTKLFNHPKKLAIPNLVGQIIKK